MIKMCSLYKYIKPQITFMFQVVHRCNTEDKNLLIQLWKILKSWKYYIHILTGCFELWILLLLEVHLHVGTFAEVGILPEIK